MSEQVPLYKILHNLGTNPFLDINNLVENHTYKGNKDDIKLLQKYVEIFEKIDREKRRFVPDDYTQKGLIEKLTSLSTELINTEATMDEAREASDSKLTELEEKQNQTQENLASVTVKVAVAELDLANHRKNSDAKISELTAKNEAEIATLENLIATSKKESQSAINAKNQEIESANQEKARLEDEKLILKNQISNNERIISQKDEEINASKRALELLTQRFDQTKEGEDSEKAELKKQIDVLTEKIEKDTAEKEKIDISRKQLDEENKNILANLTSKLETLKKETQAKETELNLQIEKLNANSEEKEREKEEMEKNLKVSEETELKRIKNELEQLQQTSSNEKAQLEATIKTINEAKNLTDAELKAKIEELQERSQVLEKEIESKTVEKQEMEKKLKDENTVLKKELEVLITSSQQEITDLENNVKIERAQKEAEVTKINAEKDKLELENTGLKGKNRRLQTRIKELQKELDTSTANVQKLSSELEELTKKSEDSLKALQTKAGDETLTQKAISDLTLERDEAIRLKYELEKTLSLKTEAVKIEEDEKQKIQSAITVLFCYNLAKTYREVAGDIIQILKIIVVDILRVTKVKVEGFTFINLDVGGTPQISPINLKNGLKAILEYLTEMNKYAISDIKRRVTSVQVFIDPLVSRISEKLNYNLKEIQVNESNFLTYLIVLIDLFIFKVDSVFDFDLKSIKGEIDITMNKVNTSQPSGTTVNPLQRLTSLGPGAKIRPS